MKNHQLFTGTLLIGAGGGLLLEQLPFSFSGSLLQWPMLLLILGAAFLVQGAIGKERHALFPGVILFGLGVHFSAISFSAHWPTGWGMYTLIIGIAFLTQKHLSKITAFLLIGISALELFYSDFQRWQAMAVAYFNGFWPILLIGLGLYLLMKKK